MSKKYSRKSRELGVDSFSYPNSLEGIRKMKEEIAVREIQILEKALSSKSPTAIVEAKNYIQKNSSRNTPELTSFTFSPENEFYNGLGYKNRPTSLSYDLLRSMAMVPQIAAIISTRIEQSMNYSQFTTDMNRQGWTIQKRGGKFFDEEKMKLSSQDKREIEGIVTWLENGGNDIMEWEREDLSDFFKKVFKDSWELDQASFEISWLRKGIPYQYMAVDGGTIRLAETYDDREYQASKGKDGYLPKYVQVYKNQVYNEYLPWQLCLGMRNVSSDVRKNGYSVSELEVLIQVITWMLYGMQYNGNFFQQGSNPKGLLNFKNNIDPTKIEEFKQAWRNTLTGVNNSHKMAVTSGADVEWISMQHNNKDMEFHQWNEFLTVLSCVTFRIDPDEVGFHLQGSRSVFGQDGQKQRLAHSKEKGLEPFLRYWQSQFDKYLVKPLFKGKYEFVFTGINPEDESVTLELDIKKLINGGISLQSFFKKYSSKELDTKKDIILNQIALQYKQMEQFGSNESNEAVDELTGEDTNPYEQFEEGEENVFTKALGDYINQLK